MTPAFRTGLYAVNAPVADEDVISHLRCIPARACQPCTQERLPRDKRRYVRRRLFAELQLGARFSVDPTSLASVLNLDHAVQQVRWQRSSNKAGRCRDAGL